MDVFCGSKLDLVSEKRLSLISMILSQLLNGRKSKASHCELHSQSIGAARESCFYAELNDKIGFSPKKWNFFDVVTDR